MISRLKDWLETGFRLLPQSWSLNLTAGGKREGERLAMTPENLRWLKRRWLELLGKPGVVGIGLLAICLPFYFSAIVPAQERLNSARRDAVSLQEKIKLEARGVKVARPPEEQLAEFYKMFPSDKNLPQWLGKIFDSAQNQGISLDQGEYKVIPDKTGSLIGFQMTLPIKGEYPKIRQYLAGLMADIPILSLENVQFDRQKVGETTVDAKVKLVLYLEQGS